MKLINLSKIKISKSLHLRTSDNVDDLVESIKEVGLLNPLIVNEQYKLLAGGRRYAALKKLKHKRVSVVIYEHNDVVVSSILKDTDLTENIVISLFEKLVNIDENLARKELGSKESSDQLVERKKIYLKLHPETKHGITGGKAGNRKKKKIENDTVPSSKKSKIKPTSKKQPSFVEDTSKKTGHNKRTIERAIRCVEKASIKVGKLWEQKQINPSQVNELVKLSVSDQNDIVKHLIGATKSETKEIIKDVLKSGIKKAIKNIDAYQDMYRYASTIRMDSNSLNKVLLEVMKNKVKFSSEYKKEIELCINSLIKIMKKFLQR